MKLSDIAEDQQLHELLPALGAMANAVGGVAKSVGGAVAGGVKAVGGALGQAAQAAAGTLGGGATDPAQAQKIAAANAMQMAERKKQIQDDIKNKQQEIQDLQKQLATLK